MRKDLKQYWPSWKEYDHCTDAEKEQANLRSIAPYEVVLDCESKEHFESTRKQLKKDHLAFMAYETNKGGHIHLKFPELIKLDEKDRNYLRLLFIKKYGADLTKKDEGTLIAIEGQPHFKTGKIKKLVEKYETTYVSLLSPDIIDEYLNKPLQTKQVEMDKQNLNGADLVQRIKQIPLAEVCSYFAGRNFKNGLNLCALHNDKAPSFSIDAKTNLWRCFGACDCGGSAIDFVMELKNCDAKEAVHLIREAFLNG
jgi:hypothetical protein